MAKAPKKSDRTGGGLRDVLFNEIEELQNGTGDPTRAMAIANLARQIVNTAKCEIEFHRYAQSIKDGGAEVTLGTLQLGKSRAGAASVTSSVTDR